MITQQQIEAIRAIMGECDSIEDIRYINQQIIMPEMQTRYAKRVQQYRDTLDWGDVAFVPWGDGYTYCCIIGDAPDEHAAVIQYLDGGKFKTSSAELKMISATAIISSIEAEAGSAEWRAEAAARIEAAYDSIMDYKPAMPENIEKFLDKLAEIANS